MIDRHVTSIQNTIKSESPGNRVPIIAILGESPVDLLDAQEALSFDQSSQNENHELKVWTILILVGKLTYMDQRLKEERTTRAIDSSKQILRLSALSQSGIARYLLFSFLL